MSVMRGCFARTVYPHVGLKTHRTPFQTARPIACRAVTRGSAEGKATHVIKRFYELYNAGDVDGVLNLMADDIEYHDLALYNEPFRGKEEVRAFFEHVVNTLPRDLKFSPEALTTGDDRAVGVQWHVDIDGHEFPFSRGVSFYEVNEDGKITRGRDLVESAVKPGGGAMQVLKLLAPLVRKLGPRANPANLPPTNGIVMWAFYAVYIWHVMLSPNAPGSPAWAQPPEGLQEVFNESINFFYVNIGLNALGISPLPAVASHPVSEAIFNFVIAWTLALGPLMWADHKAAKVENKMLWFGASMFVTNVFFVPFMAWRETVPAAGSAITGPNPPGETAEEARARLPAVAPAAGWTALVIGVISVFWALAARPEFGGLPERLQYAYDSLLGQRIFYAFVLDAVLNTVWQATLMPPAAGRLRFIPFFGLVKWLVGR